jgi:hypothetical protein
MPEAGTRVERKFFSPPLALARRLEHFRKSIKEKVES